MGTKITNLTALATAPDTLDVVAIVDVSDPTQAPSGTTKKITIADLGFLASGDNISLLNNDSGFITASDYSNNGEAAAGDRDLGNTNAFALSLITNGVGRLHIEAGGDVGIGTTTPSEKLEVSGSIKMVDGNQAVGKVLTCDANGVGSWQFGDGNGMFDSSNNATGWGVTAFNIPATTTATHATGASMIWTTQNNGTSHIFNTNAINKNNNLIWQEFGTNVGQLVYDNVSSGVRGDGFKFFAKNTFTTDGETIWLDKATDNVVIPNGNLGIGTNTPSEKLEVAGNAYINGNIGVSASPLVNSRIYIEQENALLPPYNHAITLKRNGGLKTYTVGMGTSGVSFDNLRFQQDGIDVFGINNSGDFDILKNANIEGDLKLKWGSNLGLIALFDASYEQSIRYNDNGRQIKFDNKAAAGNPDFIFSWSGTQQGNIGIGTSTPTEKLEVAGNIKTSSDLQIGKQLFVGIADTGQNVAFDFQNIDAKVYALRMQDQSGNFLMNIRESGNTSFGTTADLGARLGVSGNAYVSGSIGIGTAAPLSKLDVEGGVAIGTGYSGATAAPTNGAIIQGNVGIGTTTPSDKLEVSGNLNATRYKVNGVAGANFSGAVTNITVVDGIVTAVS